MREREFAAAGSAKMNSSCSHLLDTIGAYRKSAYIYYMYVYMYIYMHKYHFQTCFRFALPFNTGPSWPGYSPALRPLRSSVQGNHERQLGWQRPWDLGHPSGYLTLENRWTSPIFLRIFYGNLPGMVGSRKKKWDKPSISPWNGDFSQLSKLHGWARPR